MFGSRRVAPHRAAHRTARLPPSQVNSLVRRLDSANLRRLLAPLRALPSARS